MLKCCTVVLPPDRGGRTREKTVSKAFPVGTRVHVIETGRAGAVTTWFDFTEQRGQ